MKLRINHVDKNDFLEVYQAVHSQAFTAFNINAGIAGIGIKRCHKGSTHGLEKILGIRDMPGAFLFGNLRITSCTIREAPNAPHYLPHAAAQ